jgi:hypothetical protein
MEFSIFNASITNVSGETSLKGFAFASSMFFTVRMLPGYWVNVLMTGFKKMILLIFFPVFYHACKGQLA